MNEFLLIQDASQYEICFLIIYNSTYSKPQIIRFPNKHVNLIPRWNTFDSNLSFEKANIKDWILLYKVGVEMTLLVNQYMSDCRSHIVVHRPISLPSDTLLFHWHLLFLQTRRKASTGWRKLAAARKRSTPSPVSRKLEHLCSVSETVVTCYSFVSSKNP